MKGAWRREPLGLAGLAVLLIVALLAVIAPLIAPSPDAINALHRLEAPSAAHFFGTDNFGRDVFSRTLFAGRVSLGLGVIVTLITMVAGTILGMAAGFYRALDGLVMRIMDGMMGFPPLILAIALVAALGAGLTSEVIALSAVFTPRVARIARGSTLHLKQSEYIEAAVASGSRTRVILFRHLLPNELSPLVVAASFIYAETILSDAALSFLGLGVAPPTPTWGNMIADARDYLTVAPWFALFPGIAILLSASALNLLGDALRNVLMPARLPAPPAARARAAARAIRRGKQRKDSDDGNSPAGRRDGQPGPSRTRLAA